MAEVISVVRVLEVIRVVEVVKVAMHSGLKPPNLLQ